MNLYFSGNGASYPTRQRCFFSRPAKSMTSDLLDFGLTAGFAYPQTVRFFHRDFDVVRAWALGPEYQRKTLLPLYKELSEREKKSPKTMTKAHLRHLLHRHGYSLNEIRHAVASYLMQIGLGSKDQEELVVYGYGPSSHVWSTFLGLMADPLLQRAVYRDVEQSALEAMRPLPKEYFRKLYCPDCTHNALEYLESTGVAEKESFRWRAIQEYERSFPKPPVRGTDSRSRVLWVSAVHHFLRENYFRA